MVTPDTAVLIVQAAPWSPATPGPIAGDVVSVSIESEKDLDRYRGKLAGKIVLDGLMRAVPPVEMRGEFFLKVFRNSCRPFSLGDMATSRQSGWSDLTASFPISDVGSNAPDLWQSSFRARWITKSRTTSARPR
jgi:hypothetical protein